MTYSKRFFYLFMLATLAPTVQAKIFKTEIIKLDLPPNWDCKKEEQDWVCQPDNLNERSEAMMIVVTKLSNAVDDMLPKYSEILKQPKAMNDLLGNPYLSTVKYVNQRDIKGHPWVDGLHLGSEIPGFYSRYIATVKEAVAGLITYSIGESVYPKYADMMDQMISSLEIFYDPKVVAELQKQSPMSLLSARRGGKAGARTAAEEESAGDTKKDEKSDPSMLIGIGIIIAAAGYFVWKKKQQKG